ncbi:MAG: twin-arginine translocase subunit TatC [Aggregatilineales bacterium]
MKIPLRNRKQRELPPPQEPEDNELRMGFFDHLDELRGRTFKILIAVVLGTILGSIIAGDVLQYLIEPYANIYPDETQRLVVLGPTGAVVTYFKVALMVGGILSIPVITYQILLFIVPGLTSKERRYLLSALPAITLLFLIGVAFAWFILIPPAITFLEGFQSDIFKPEWTAENYISFVTALLFWMGVSFETPLVFFLMSLFGIVTAGLLVKNWRFAVVGTAIAAALITPTIDPVNMFLVMGPLLALYGFSIILVMIGSRITRA